MALFSGAACASNSSVPVSPDLQEEYVDSSKGTTSCSVPHQPENEDEEWMGCIEEKPLFPGGDMALMKFIQKHLFYPEELLDERPMGRVLISFFVEEDGSLSNVGVVRGLHPLLDAEALRVVNMMPKWKPAKLQGKVVRVRYTLPILFERELKEEKNDSTVLLSPSARQYQIVRSDSPENQLDDVAVADVNPQFSGGVKALTEFLAKNINYPVMAGELGGGGSVLLSFIVEKDGSLSNVKVVQGIDSLLDAEAVRVVKSMPQWIPAKRENEVVRCRHLLPIGFSKR